MRILAAGVTGAAVYFVWGMLAWMVLPLHSSTIHRLPAESQVTQALTTQNLETGVYVVPWPTSESDMADPASEYMKRHTAGPIFSIYYQQQGATPMDTGVLIGGFIIDLLAACLAACLVASLGGCGRQYLCRVGCVTGLGIFVALIGHASYWNWMNFPWGYTVAFMADVIIGWTLAGLAIAAWIRPTSSSSTLVAATPAKENVTSSEPRERSMATTAASLPGRSEAITLLAALQREARFLDIVKEPLADYSDAQVGAAARDVLRDCGVVLDRLFQLEPVVDAEEGGTFDVPAGFDPALYRVTGNPSGEPPWTGALAHHGWRATRCDLPQWTGDKSTAQVIAAAEVEIQT